MNKAVVTSASQVDKLRSKMQEKGVTHAAEVRADIRGVRVGQGESPERVSILQKLIGHPTKKAPVFFCNIRGFENLKVLQNGDGNPLPDRATIRGLKVEGSGLFNLLNARVFSNGQINVVVDRATRVVPLTWEEEPFSLL